MPYDATEFLEKQPHECYVCQLDTDSERGIFAARWPSEDFQSPLDFQIFLFKFSSLLQPYIHGLREVELESYFQSDENAVAKAKDFHRAQTIIASDAKEWLAREFSFAKIPWLQSNDHENSMELTVDDTPELFAFGENGYLTIFVADLIAEVAK